MRNPKKKRRRTSRGQHVTLADATTRPGDMVPVKVFRNGGELLMYVTVTATVPGHLHFEGQPVTKKER